MFASLLYADGGVMPQAAAPAGAQGFMSFVPFIAVLAIMYFLMIRPQQKRQKEHQTMLDALQKGDQILTSGGIYGTVVGLRGNDVEIKIADDVKVRIIKSAIGTVIKPDTATANNPEVVVK